MCGLTWSTNFFYPRLGDAYNLILIQTFISKPLHYVLVVSWLNVDYVFSADYYNQHKSLQSCRIWFPLLWKLIITAVYPLQPPPEENTKTTNKTNKHQM